jgi:hypothetical protein
MTSARILRYWPSLIAFILIAVGTVVLINARESSVASLDRVPTLVLTERVEQGTNSVNLVSLIEIRQFEPEARPEGALSSIEELPEGVLASTHVAGQALLATSIAPNRVAPLGPGFVAISVRLDSQRWVGPVLLTGRTVDIYDIDPDAPRLISPAAVVVEVISPTAVDPKQETILSLGVREETLPAVLAAASDNRIWLVGR